MSRFYIYKNQSMDSLRIYIDVLGQQISFDYCQKKMPRGQAWSATIVDECRTIEEELLATSPEDCLDAIVPLLVQFGNVTRITSADTNSPYIEKLLTKIASYT